MITARQILTLSCSLMVWSCTDEKNTVETPPKSRDEAPIKSALKNDTEPVLSQRSHVTLKSNQLVTNVASLAGNHEEMRKQWDVMSDPFFDEGVENGVLLERLGMIVSGETPSLYDELQDEGSRVRAS